jgi:putative flippase GtrA
MSSGQAPRSGFLQLAGFLVSGSLAFLVDVVVTKVLAGFAGLPWGISRIIAIGVAMVVAWLCHRRLTFAVTTPISIAEFIKYAGVGWSAAALNYVVFLVFIWLLPDWDKAFAIGVASLVAMVSTYVGLRFGVFAKQ